jgi:hypothetical protein
MEHGWNDTDGRKQKDLEKGLSHCHFIHHKSHIQWRGREPRPPQWEAGDQPTAWAMARPVYDKFRTISSLSSSQSTQQGLWYCFQCWTVLKVMTDMNDRCICYPTISKLTSWQLQVVSRLVSHTKSVWLRCSYEMFSFHGDGTTRICAPSLVRN